MLLFIWEWQKGIARHVTRTPIHSIDTRKHCQCVWVCVGVSKCVNVFAYVDVCGSTISRLLKITGLFCKRAL